MGSLLGDIMAGRRCAEAVAWRWVLSLISPPLLSFAVGDIYVVGVELGILLFLESAQWY